ncbi:MAG: phage tail assembly chaperone [Paracoccaceae bacterium]|jgi:hypothetical protein|nr:phage tail assembly chaperone [Paracoccaceae bacterium]MDP7187053.1 phage tail assembly chaperone [Paracoccaceae bacterium]
MHVKLIDGTPVPYSLAELRRDNPTVSFPLEIPDDLAAEWGLLPLTPTPAPGIDRLTEALEETTPQLSNGVWTQVWTVVALSQAEAERRVRTERDRRLAACDWVVIRAKELGQSVPGPWFTYRGDLRQVPEQPDFPFGVIWPVPPE